MGMAPGSWHGKTRPCLVSRMQGNGRGGYSCGGQCRGIVMEWGEWYPLGGKKIALWGGGGDTEAHFPNPPPASLAAVTGGGVQGGGARPTVPGGGGGQPNIYGSK